MLEGKVAVVTDSGKGLGREIAVLMAHEGTRVVAHDSGGHAGKGERVLPGAEKVAREIREGGGEAVVNAESVNTWEGSHRLIQAAIDHFGRVDILVNSVNLDIVLRGKEVYSFNQSSVVRSIHNAEGWSARKLANVLEPTFKQHLTPLDNSITFFDWEVLL